MSPPAHPAAGSEASRRDLRRLLAYERVDLARAALAIAREEYPDLQDAPTLKALDELGARARASLPRGASIERKVGRLNAFLFILPEAVGVNLSGEGLRGSWVPPATG